MFNGNESKCFCIGLGLGVAAAFLFAPKSGPENREYLQNKTLEGAGYVKDQAANAVSAANDAVERGSKAIRHQKENFAAAIEAGKSAYNQAAATTPS